MAQSKYLGRRKMQDRQKFLGVKRILTKNGGKKGGQQKKKEKKSLKTGRNE